MPSIPEQIAETLRAGLAGNTDAGAAVYRDREDAITREEDLVILIELGDEDSTPLGGQANPFTPVERNELRAMVTVVVRGANWQSRADVVRLQAHQRLTQLLPLWQLASQCRRERTEWRPANTDQPFGFVSTVYVFTYLGNGFNLALPP
jgi:hypothetical protein